MGATSQNKEKFEDYVRKKNCLDCVHCIDYHRWGEYRCTIVGWIGIGQTKYHPDKTADTCKHYHLDRIRQEKDT